MTRDRRQTPADHEAALTRHQVTARAPDAAAAWRDLCSQYFDAHQLAQQSGSCACRICQACRQRAGREQGFEQL